MQSLLARRANAAGSRQSAYRESIDAIQDEILERQRFIDQHLSRGRDQDHDYGLELWIGPSERFRVKQMLSQ